MKKFLLALLVMGLMALSYYLFIMPYEFEVTLKARTMPGDIIETIRIWNKSLDSAQITEVDSFAGLKQTIVQENRTYNYNWYFKVREGVTQVNLLISEPGREFLNKVTIPFTEQPIEKDAALIATEFNEVLKKHLELTNVKVIGESVLDSAFCICSTLETKQVDKARGMMKDYPLLNSFLDNFKVESAGPPIIRVLAWDHSAGTLKFDFCFHILESDSLPAVESLTYKRFGKEKVLKAEYYGNYITSDRAWYELLHYAKEKGYKTTGLPIENFMNDPNFGGNDKTWRADVYLPLSDN